MCLSRTALRFALAVAVVWLVSLGSAASPQARAASTERVSVDGAGNQGNGDSQDTAISADVLKGTGRFNEHVASWSTKRRWVDEAFNALERAG